MLFFVKLVAFVKTCVLSVMDIIEPLFENTAALVRKIMNTPLDHSKVDCYKFLLIYNKDGKTEATTATLTTPFATNQTIAKALVKWKCKEYGCTVENIFCFYNLSQDAIETSKKYIFSAAYCELSIPNIYEGEIKELGILDSYTQKCLALIVREQPLDMLATK